MWTNISRSKEFILAAIILKLLQHPIIHRLVLSRIDSSHAYWCTIAVRFQHLSNIWATFRPYRLGSLWQGRTSKKNPVHSKPRLEIYGNPRGGAARAPCIDFLPVIGTVPPYDFLNLYGVFDSRFSIHFHSSTSFLWETARSEALRAGPIGLYFWPDNVTLRKTCCPRDITFRPKKSTLFKPGSANFL